MIATFDDGKHLHVIKWTGRVRLHAGAVAYCEATHDASNGVLQVPDQVFTQGVAFAVGPGQKRTPCPKCRMTAFASLG